MYVVIYFVMSLFVCLFVGVCLFAYVRLDVRVCLVCVFVCVACVFHCSFFISLSVGVLVKLLHCMCLGLFVCVCVSSLRISNIGFMCALVCFVSFCLYSVMSFIVCV